MGLSLRLDDERRSRRRCKPGLAGMLFWSLVRLWDPPGEGIGRHPGGTRRLDPRLSSPPSLVPAAAALVQMNWGGNSEQWGCSYPSPHRSACSGNRRMPGALWERLRFWSSPGELGHCGVSRAVPRGTAASELGLPDPSSPHHSLVLSGDQQGPANVPAAAGSNSDASAAATSPPDWEVMETGDPDPHRPPACGSQPATISRLEIFLNQPRGK